MYSYPKQSFSDLFSPKKEGLVSNLGRTKYTNRKIRKTFSIEYCDMILVPYCKPGEHSAFFKTLTSLYAAGTSLEPIKLPQMYMSSIFLIFLLVSFGRTEAEEEESHTAEWDLLSSCCLVGALLLVQKLSFFIWKYQES